MAAILAYAGGLEGLRALAGMMLPGLAEAEAPAGPEAAVTEAAGEALGRALRERSPITIRLDAAGACFALEIR